jgi:hypothetical protein
MSSTSGASPLARSFGLAPRWRRSLSGVFCTSARPTAWLGCKTRTAESVGIKIRACCRESLPIWPKWRGRDGSRESCGVSNVQLGQGFRLALRGARLNGMTAGLFDMPGW